MDAYARNAAEDKTGADAHLVQRKSTLDAVRAGRRSAMMNSMGDPW
jgi:hypothetical protein